MACADLQAVHGGIAEEGAAGQAVQNVHARKGCAHKEEQQAQCDAQPQACVDGDEEAAQECGQPHEAVHLADLSHAQAPVTCVFQWHVGAAVWQPQSFSLLQFEALHINGELRK